MRLNANYLLAQCDKVKGEYPISKGNLAYIYPYTRPTLKSNSRINLGPASPEALEDLGSQSSHQLPTTGFAILGPNPQ